MENMTEALDQMGRFIFSTNPLDNLTALQEHQRVLYRIAELGREIRELQAEVAELQAEV